MESFSFASTQLQDCNTRESSATSKANGSRTPPSSCIICEPGVSYVTTVTPKPSKLSKPEFPWPDESFYMYHSCSSQTETYSPGKSSRHPSACPFMSAHKPKLPGINTCYCNHDIPGEMMTKYDSKSHGTSVQSFLNNILDKTAADVVTYGIPKYNGKTANKPNKNGSPLLNYSDTVKVINSASSVTNALFAQCSKMLIPRCNRTSSYSPKDIQPRCCNGSSSYSPRDIQPQCCNGTPSYSPNVMQPQRCNGTSSYSPKDMQPQCCNSPSFFAPKDIKPHCCNESSSYSPRDIQPNSCNGATSYSSKDIRPFNCSGTTSYSPKDFLPRSCNETTSCSQKFNPPEDSGIQNDFGNEVIIRGRILNDLRKLLLQPSKSRQHFSSCDACSSTTNAPLFGCQCFMVNESTSMSSRQSSAHLMCIANRESDHGACLNCGVIGNSYESSKMSPEGGSTKIENSFCKCKKSFPDWL